MARRFAKVSEEYGFEAILRPPMFDEMAGEGSTERTCDDDGFLMVTGVEIIAPEAVFDDDDADEVLDIGLFTSVLVSMSHEYQHVRQIIRDTRARDFVSREVSTKLYASFDNPAYYELNYFSDVSEIDAECRGVREVHYVLSSSYGDEFADKCLRAYWERRRDEIGSDFVDVSLTCGGGSIQDVFDAYGKAFKAALESSRVYDADVARMVGDRLMFVIDSRPTIGEKFGAESVGCRQDKMVASLYFWNRPHLSRPVREVLREVRKLSGVNYSPGAVFGESGRADVVRRVAGGRGAEGLGRSRRRMGSVLRTEDILGSLETTFDDGQTCEFE